MEKSGKNIGVFTKIVLVISGIMLGISIFTPIWRIELSAPQYPEGLSLSIFANKLGGEVEIINGLNHYIGMKTLHAEEFVEFTVLPYIIGAFAMVCLFMVFVKKKRGLYLLFNAFVLFGVVAMVDFWRWEYNYGHNLNPNAAIIVPGMAYQPPLIGFKQLLNFGAYSIPDIGGWLFVASGMLMAIAVVIETKVYMKFKRKKKAAVTIATIMLAVISSSCGEMKAEPIKLNKDNCDNCGMTITDPKFSTEILTDKGRVYKFDDISCMINYKKDNAEKVAGSKFYISEYIGDNHFIPAETAILVYAKNINSPMGGNTAAFSRTDSASIYAIKYDATINNWKNITK